MAEKSGLQPFVDPQGELLSARMAREDDEAISSGRRRFSDGRRPVIRWIKGDGLDDAVTRAAIGQATRLFGDEVDYCLCTNAIDAARARDILSWAVRPVEWWPLSRDDNPRLGLLLERAGCPPEHYGYWWKWFPERVRPDAPEWILDGDMIVVGKPDWYEAWRDGKDVCRVTKDNRWPAAGLYGRYVGHIDLTKRLYSGLFSLMPGQTFMSDIARVLARQPLNAWHDGRREFCEQGVVVAAFQRVAQPIPLYEFPFARGFDPALDFGLEGDQRVAWGYHFGGSFRHRNPHFERLSAQGSVLTLPEEPGLGERFSWLGGAGQWGLPGWSLGDPLVHAIIQEAAPLAGGRALELGTSRGKLSAVLAGLGCRVTTVDRQDRGAAVNLEGLDVEVVVAEAVAYVASLTEMFPLIVVDVHGNTPAVWDVLGPLLLKRLEPGGSLLINNAMLHTIPEWRDENGVLRFLENMGPGHAFRLRLDCLPGLAVVTHA